MEEKIKLMLSDYTSEKEQLQKEQKESKTISESSYIAGRIMSYRYVIADLKELLKIISSNV